MQLGANTFIWRSPFSTSTDIDLLEKVKEMGFDVIEVAIEDPYLVNITELKAAADANGLGVVVCGAFGPGRNISSLDKDERTNASAYLTWCIDAAAELGAKIVCGPMYSAVGKARLENAADREQEWSYAVSGLQKHGAYAAEHGVKLAFEPLNRFETDMINVVEQGLRLINDVANPAVGFHLDTFHMHLEEKDTAAAIRNAGTHVFHVHACENDRGVPGTGQVSWSRVFQALRDINYDGAVVIESFTPEVQSIAKAVCIWRNIAPSQDAIAADGLAFLKQHL